MLIVFGPCSAPLRMLTGLLANPYNSATALPAAGGASVRMRGTETKAAQPGWGDARRLAW